MGNMFAASDVVEIGVQIEINGRDFYYAVAEKSKDKKAKDIFNLLAGEEVKHILTFQKILESVKRYEPREAYPEEYFAYMNSLASEYVFTQKDKGKEIAKNTKTDIEAAQVGIGFEKDSILFYVGIKEVLPTRDHPVIETLIGQEKEHLRKLTDLKTALKR